MPFNLTNLSGSFVRIPHNKKTKSTYALVPPGGSVVVSEDYIEALTPEAKARFARVCQKPDPMFRVAKVK
jgi:hypothetical protein